MFFFPSNFPDTYFFLNKGSSQRGQRLREKQQPAANPPPKTEKWRSAEVCSKQDILTMEARGFELRDARTKFLLPQKAPPLKEIIGIREVFWL